MSEVQETPLPGVGLRYDFESHHGERVGVLVHRTGRRDLLVYDRDDPDRCKSTVELEPDDALTLAELLGANQIGEALTTMRQNVEGLAIDWLPITAASPLGGQTLAESGIHTRTGVSIVAVLRGTETIPAPGADTRIEAGDTIVGVGTPEGMEQLFALFDQG